MEGWAVVAGLEEEGWAEEDLAEEDSAEVADWAEVGSVVAGGSAGED